MTKDLPARNAWRRLKHNKGALFGIIIIAAAIFIAVFAYWFSPDSSPYANRMIVEIGGQKPGFTIKFLKIPALQNKEGVSFFERLLYGKPDLYQFLPVNSIERRGDSLVAQQYIGEDAEIAASFAINQITNNPDAVLSSIETKTFYLGTDRYGRDILSRLMIGVRVSLGVGLITVIISLTIGVLLGAFAGYFRGRTDDTIMWFINVIWSIPTLLLVFAITLMLGKGFWQIFIAIGLTMWVNVARIVRGQILSVRELEYVEAAKALGYSSGRILFRHILPNIMGPVLVVAASNFASAIVIEAGLSFLGIGVQPPQPSWGLMIKENYNFIITHNPMLALAPGFAIMLLVLAFNLLGNGLRDALAVKA
jgi:ABC-type dipeptide/oligopeptide/nickel transport system permease subunit